MLRGITAHLSGALRWKSCNEVRSNKLEMSGTTECPAIRAIARQGIEIPGEKDVYGSTELRGLQLLS